MIRRPKQEDAAALAEICREALGHAADPALVAQQIARLNADPAYMLLAAEESGKVVGFLQAQTYDLLYGGRGMNIIALAVAPGWQGRGVGTGLLAALEEGARQEGRDFIRLNARVEREAAHRFYERQGFVCDKTQKRFIKRLENRLGV